MSCSVINLRFVNSKKKFTHYCCYKFDSCIDHAPPRKIQTLNKFVFNSKWPPLLLCLLERVHLK